MLKTTTPAQYVLILIDMIEEQGYARDALLEEWAQPGHEAPLPRAPCPHQAKGRRPLAGQGGASVAQRAAARKGLSAVHAAAPGRQGQCP